MLKEPEKTPGAGRGAVEEKRPLVVPSGCLVARVFHHVLPIGNAGFRAY